MILDRFTQGRMAIIFNHLANQSMVDSPDGQAAEKMRAMAGKTELDDGQLRYVLGVASGQATLYSKLLETEAERRRSRSILTAFALDAAADPAAGLAEIDACYPLPDDPHLRVAEAAVDLLNLLGSYVKTEPTPPAQQS